VTAGPQRLLLSKHLAAVFVPSCLIILHEWRQREWIARVLDTEDAQQKAVDKEQGAAERNDCDLLRLGLSNSWDLDSERDRAKRQNTI
jgi:hypothetical protein